MLLDVNTISYNASDSQTQSGIKALTKSPSVKGAALSKAEKVEATKLKRKETREKLIKEYMELKNQSSSPEQIKHLKKLEEDIINAYLSIVNRIVSTFKMGKNIKDHQQNGRIAIWKALRDYDPQHKSGAQFFTVAVQYITTEFRTELNKNKTIFSRRTVSLNESPYNRKRNNRTSISDVLPDKFGTPEEIITMQHTMENFSGIKQLKKEVEALKLKFQMSQVSKSKKKSQLISIKKKEKTLKKAEWFETALEHRLNGETQKRTASIMGISCRNYQSDEKYFLGLLLKALDVTIK